MTVPEWRLVGDWFDICSCDIPCPCEFAQAPTDNACQGMLAWHVREGQYGDVELDGLNVVALGAFEGNLWAGEAKVVMGMYIDEKADEPQREALQADLRRPGRRLAGGFAANIGEMRGIEFVPISFRGGGRPGLLAGRDPRPRRRARRGADRPHDTARQARADDQPAGLGGRPGPDRHLGPFGRGAHQGLRPRLDGHGRSSKHIPFDWTGPELGCLA